MDNSRCLRKETEPLILAGIDLAWQSEKNPSAIAVGTLDGSVLTINTVEPAVYGIDQVFQKLEVTPRLSGIAIDAPLIISNDTGQRNCEKELGREYGSRKASCHTSNLGLYPDAKSVSLSDSLMNAGFSHLETNSWQIECYPHPAIIEIFGLNERLQYKKGKVSEKRQGQKELATMIGGLRNSDVVQLVIDGNTHHFIDVAQIEALGGQALKSNEDALDAIICLYIAALYAMGTKGKTFGDLNTGYIWVPRILCVGSSVTSTLKTLPRITHGSSTNLKEWL